MTRWASEESWLIPGRAKHFLYSQTSRPTVGPTRLRIKWVTGTPSLGVELSRHDANHSPPHRTGVGNKRRYTSILPYALMERVSTALSIAQVFKESCRYEGVLWRTKLVFTLQQIVSRSIDFLGGDMKNTVSIAKTLRLITVCSTCIETLKYAFCLNWPTAWLTNELNIWITERLIH